MEVLLAQQEPLAEPNNALLLPKRRYEFQFCWGFGTTWKTTVINNVINQTVRTILVIDDR